MVRAAMDGLQQLTTVEQVARERERVQRRVRRHSPSDAILRQQRQDDRTGAGAEVERTRAAAGGLQMREHDADEQLRLRSRDQRPRVDRERDAVELLHAAEVRDRLTRLASRDQRLEGRLCVRADRRVAVSDDRRPVHADREREQQLGVQSRGLGTSCPQALGPRLDEGAGRGHRGRVRVGS